MNESTTQCRLLVSLVAVETLIAFQLMFEVWDIFTESVLHLTFFSGATFIKLILMVLGE